MAKQTYAYVGKYSDGGSQNSFYKVKGKKYGFKSFPNKSLATFAHAVQHTLAKENLAPYVHSPVCRIRVPNYFMGKNGKTITQMVLSDWGYLTEIAKPFVCESGDYCDGDCANDNGCVHNDAISSLLDSIEACDLDYIDAHPANLGYVMRNNNPTLVIIDCGAESIVVTEEGVYPDVCWDGAEDYDCRCEACRKKYAYD